MKTFDSRAGLFRFIALFPVWFGVLLSTASGQVLPPPLSVHFRVPMSGQCFYTPVDIRMVAEARGPDGSTLGVGFFADNLKLGDGVLLPASGSTNLYGLIWSNAPAGVHWLTVRATDLTAAGTGTASSVSETIQITVQPGPSPPRQPVVTIRAVDPYASEPCSALTVIDPALFTVSRDFGTDRPLLVAYSILGTATNGKDYIALSNTVVIPVGAPSVNIPVAALPDDLAENVESVVLRIEPPVCPAIYPPDYACYLVGQPSEATVFIRDCLKDLPPLVRISEPRNGAAFPAEVDIRIAAETMDPDGYVWKVEFFAGRNKIGEDSKMFFVAPTNGTPISYEMLWAKVPPGKYVLTARATDSQGLFGISPPVEIAVGLPPITNRPPVVSIVATDPVAIEGTNCWPWWSTTNRWPMNAGNLCTLSPDSGALIWWFTNCGPKNATLTIRRFGDTNTDLLVSYKLGGTATNGVDYEFLPGMLTIPAGQRKADLLILPKPDQHPDPVRTVVVRLIPPPWMSPLAPPYTIGYPACAAAIIVDSDRPRPPTGTLPDRCFHLGSNVADGSWYDVAWSGDLQNWTPVGTFQAIQGMLHFVDPEAQESSTRFYRASEVAPPAD